jgi:hypothetical protein
MTKYVASVGILLLACSYVTALSPQIPDATPAYQDRDAYEVYNVILNDRHWGPGNDARLVIRAETKPFGLCLKAAVEMGFGSVITDYENQNQQKWLLQQNFQIDRPYTLVPTAATPNRWVELSAVGFDADKTLAMVYVGLHCSGLCGAGKIRYLQKKEGKWQELLLQPKSGCGWMS